MGIYNISWTASPSIAFGNIGATLGSDGAYRLTCFARLRYLTDATSVDVEMVSDVYGTFPAWSHIGVWVDGSPYAVIAATQAAMKYYTQSLPAGNKTVEFVIGLQSRPSSTVLGTFVRRIQFAQPSITTQAQGPTGGALVVYGDSLAVGGDATYPTSEGWSAKIAANWAGPVVVDAFGYRALYDDANTSNLRAALVAEMAGARPSAIWLAIGTNDYGLNKWSASSFGSAYASLLDDLHTALPSAQIYCQTPILRVSPGGESANGNGSTLGNYRTQIAAAQGARSSYCTLVDGSAILSAGVSYDSDGIHPSTAGHAVYYAAVRAALGL